MDTGLSMEPEAAIVTTPLHPGIYFRDAAPPEAGSGGPHDSMNAVELDPLSTMMTGKDYSNTSGDITVETVH